MEPGGAPRSGSRIARASAVARQKNCGTGRVEVAARAMCCRPIPSPAEGMKGGKLRATRGGGELSIAGDRGTAACGAGGEVRPVSIVAAFGGCVVGWWVGLCVRVPYFCWHGRGDLRPGIGFCTRSMMEKEGPAGPGDSSRLALLLLGAGDGDWICRSPGLCVGQTQQPGTE